jgi:hypothetical protein
MLPVQTKHAGPTSKTAGAERALDLPPLVVGCHACNAMSYVTHALFGVRVVRPGLTTTACINAGRVARFDGTRSRKKIAKYFQVQILAAQAYYGIQSVAVARRGMHRGVHPASPRCAKSSSFLGEMPARILPASLVFSLVPLFDVPASDVGRPTAALSNRVARDTSPYHLCP